jgi:hypothetical protein
MDFSNKKPCIVTVGINGWYKAGVERLERSLVTHGYAGDMLMYKGEYPPNSPTHEENPYSFKIYALEQAALNHDVLLWLDASFWNIKNCHHLFDLIFDKGIVGFRTGYNCAQTCSDLALQWAGITRDEAETIPEIASGMCGINLLNPNGAEVFKLWKEGCELGLFRNNRSHDYADSSDPRFVHARQDQSIWTLAIHKCGLNVNDVDYVSYYGTGYNEEKCLFFINGI